MPPESRHRRWSWPAAARSTVRQWPGKSANEVPRASCVGQAATGGAPVQVGGNSAEERFVLSYGDVVALSVTGHPGRTGRPHVRRLVPVAAIPRQAENQARHPGRDHQRPER